MVNLIGYTRTAAGIGQAARGCASALKKANIPFRVISEPFLHDDDTSLIDYEFQMSGPSSMDIPVSPLYSTNLIYINADQIQNFFKRSSTRFNCHYNIGCFFWELSTFPDRWLSSFDFVDEIWAASSFIHQSVSRKTSKPVFHVPCVVDISLQRNYQRNDFYLPNDRFLFLVMYDVMSITSRKNPHGAIDAFLKSFNQDQKVGLVVKINNLDQRPNEVLKIIRYFDCPNIYFITGTLSRDQTNGLLSVIDCFVSLHRSEGFGLCIAEAMFLGKNVIVTNWSGNTDFTNSANSYLVDYKIIKVGEGNEPYDPNEEWADPDNEHASYWMKRVFEKNQEARVIAQQGQFTVRTQFSAKNIGKIIDQRVRFIQKLQQDKILTKNRLLHKNIFLQHLSKFFKHKKIK